MIFSIARTVWNLLCLLFKTFQKLFVHLLNKSHHSLHFARSEDWWKCWSGSFPMVTWEASWSTLITIINWFCFTCCVCHLFSPNLIRFGLSLKDLGRVGAWSIHKVIKGFDGDLLHNLWIADHQSWIGKSLHAIVFNISHGVILVLGNIRNWLLSQNLSRNYHKNNNTMYLFCEFTYLLHMKDGIVAEDEIFWRNFDALFQPLIVGLLAFVPHKRQKWQEQNSYFYQHFEFGFVFDWIDCCTAEQGPSNSQASALYVTVPVANVHNQRRSIQGCQRSMKRMHTIQFFHD